MTCVPSALQFGRSANFRIAPTARQLDRSLSRGPSLGGGKGVASFEATKALRESIRKIVGRLRRDKGGVSHATSKASVSPATSKASVSHATSKASVSSAATSRKPSKRRSRASQTDVTGETVFDDRPLRFRSLTL